MDDTQRAAVTSPFDDGDLYDMLLGDLAFGLDFYLGLAREAPGPVLDIACGTGRVLLRCLEAGVDADGVDLYAPMLATLRKKAAARGLTPRVYQADMSDFRLPRRYALEIIACNAFVHNLTQEAQIRCLERCREHLLPGGLLAFDTYFPSLDIIGATQNTRVLEGEMTHPRTGTPVRCYDTRSFDLVKQIQHSINEVETIDAEGIVTTLQRSEHDARWVYKDEMSLLLHVAGFARWEIYGDFERTPLTRENQAMIVLAWNDG